MARRSGDWNAGLAKDLQHQEFAREFLLAAMDEGVPVQVALAKVVQATGVKEFAAKVRMARDYIPNRDYQRSRGRPDRPPSRRNSYGEEEFGPYPEGGGDWSKPVSGRK